MAATAQLVPGLNTDVAISHENRQRSYDIYLPQDPAGLPLVLDLHGLLDDTSGQRERSGLNLLADAERIIVVWPSGRGNSWNDGIAGGARTTDDVGFIRDVVADIIAQVAIDESRIYATGFSNGGGMTERLACEATDLFAAFAAFASSVPDDWIPGEDCGTNQPFPILLVRGNTDQIVPFIDGNLLGIVDVLGAQNAFRFWRDQNQCGTGPVDETIDLASGTRCQVDSTCGDGVAVNYCNTRSVEADGHNVYNNVDGVNLGSYALDFLQQYQRVESNGFEINPGLSGAWFNPDTPGQGILFDVIDSTGTLFMAWFTFESTSSEKLGAPEHRWLTASGPYSGAAANNMTVTLTAGGVFDDPMPVTNSTAGTVSVEFFSCTEGLLTYDLSGATGEILLNRLSPDVFCGVAGQKSAVIRNPR